MTATNFLDAAGTNGFIATPFNLQTTELNAQTNGAASTSSVGGSSGKFSQTDFASGIWGLIWFISGGSFTPTAGGVISGWFLQSTDGGTTFEALVSTPSTTVAALPRAPDFIIPFDAAALASGNIKFCSGLVKLPWPSCKIVLQNNTGATLPATGNIVVCGPVATQY